MPGPCRCALFFGCLLLVFGGLGARGKEDGASIRIATYNLRNYLVMDRVVDGQWHPEYPKPEAEKAAVRRAILAMDADILLLQEMGPRPFLRELQEDLSRAGLDYPYALHLEAADEARHLAALSRIEPAAVHRHVDLDFKYFESRLPVKRGLLEMVFGDPEGGGLQVFVVHLKSRWSDEPRDPGSALRREREARACRNRIIERTHDRGRTRFLVAGDFNDHPGSAPLRRFKSRGALEIAQRVEARDSGGLLWTYFYEKASRYSTVDGFFAGPGLEGAIVGGRARIVDGLWLLEGSDHRPLYLDIKPPPLR